MLTALTDVRRDGMNKPTRVISHPTGHATTTHDQLRLLYAGYYSVIV